jgi:23S rRNA pseudouridine1911/1915/1917 synthase
LDPATLVESPIFNEFAGLQQILRQKKTPPDPFSHSYDERVIWVVSTKDAGARLDKFLAAGDRLQSRGRATSALERGKVFVNDVEAVFSDAGRRLVAGDRVRVWMDRPGSAHRRGGRAKPGALPIIYEDEAIIVVNKPAGLLAVPLATRSDAPSVEDELVVHLRSHGKRRPLVVHRIDRDTSGLVVFAKRPDAQARLKDQFRRREPERIYLAIVYGHPAPRSGSWRDDLSWDQKALVQKRAHPHEEGGREARSDYQVIESFRDTSLIEVRLVTGKRNQIRVQARLHGHTLVGERLYVEGSDTRRSIPFPRQALHAFRLTILHPIDLHPLSFEAPLADDLADLVKRLRQGSEPFSGVPKSKEVRNPHG